MLYLHSFSLSLMYLLLWGSTAIEQETRCVCLVLTNLPTTFPRDLTSKTSVNDILPLSTELATSAPAPYNGTLLPCIFTDTVRRLFRCWWYFFNCSIMEFESKNGDHHQTSEAKSCFFTFKPLLQRPILNSLLTYGSFLIKVSPTVYIYKKVLINL